MKDNPKNILLTSATAKEIAPFIKHLRKQSGKIGPFHVDILITGIGLTATTYHLTSQLILKEYALVIQAGVAGSFDKSLVPGTVVVVLKETIADQSVEELKKLKTLFELNLVPQNQFPHRNGWLINPDKKLLKLTGLKQVNGISVNQISVSEKTIRFYREKFDPVTESMEGAALHYVCLMEKIPFIQLRSISNYIGERNKKKWNMEDSINNLNEVVIKTINDYESIITSS